MKTILLKVILVLNLVLGLQTSVKAQLVYIPDSNFRAILNQDYPSCMVGDSIDPTCPAVLNSSGLGLFGQSIYDLTGIEVFVNATILNCPGNRLTSLPALPSKLTRIDCSMNQITSLSNLPSSLEYLICDGNELTDLPSLPSSLKELRCYGNELTSLPILPPLLIALDCNYTQLKSLPALPSSLTYLNCNSNELTHLPALPSSITELYCEFNQLTFLPTLPSSLATLDCEFNQLTSLPLLPDSLTRLFCSRNPIKYLPDLNNVTFLAFENTLVECLPNYGIVTRSYPPLSSIPICDNDINIDIQPNPFISELKIKLDKDYSGEFEVYNSLGEIIISEKLQGRNISLSTIDWNAGLYYLKFETNEGVVVKKVVKR